MLNNRITRALIGIAVIGWGAKKLRDRRRGAPSYPAEATPRIPASETSSPS